MYDRLTDRCRDAFKAAHWIARALGKEVLDCDSFLLGVVQAGDESLTSKVLREFDLWWPLYRKIENLVILPACGRSFLQTEESRQAIEVAQAIALELDHHFIDVDHLMLGLLDRTPLMAWVLNDRKVDLHAVRKLLYRRLGVNVSTDADYRKHSDYIRALLDKDGGRRTDSGDRDTVQAIYEYLQSHLPPNAS